MLKGRGLVALLLGLAVVACSGSEQPTAGAGWTLLTTRTPSPIIQGLSIAALGEDAYVVSITIPGGGGGGCGAPTFVGFEQVGSKLVAKIARAAMPETCAIVDGVTYYVALNRVSVPPGVTSIAISESCPKAGCSEQPVPLPSG